MKFPALSHQHLFALSSMGRGWRLKQNIRDAFARRKRISAGMVHDLLQKAVDLGLAERRHVYPPGRPLVRRESEYRLTTAGAKMLQAAKEFYAAL
jgi:hypothetical protein